MKGGAGSDPGADDMIVENPNVSAVTPAKPLMAHSEVVSSSKPVEERAPEPVEPAIADVERKSAAAEDFERRKRLEIAAKLSGANKSLVIEKDPEHTGFIYKTIDRETGEVVRVWPREEIATKLAALADVDARGMMLDARA
jgi:uncharacterized FlaG/YvyC family protein